MGYVTTSFVLYVVLLTISSTSAGGKGGDGEDIHFKINVPTFIKKIKHTKTVYVHKDGGGGGGGHGGHGGGEHKITPPKAVTGYIIEKEHKTHGHGKHEGDHESFTLHNSFLKHGGHSSSSGALRLGSGHRGHEEHLGVMPASYTTRGFGGHLGGMPASYTASSHGHLGSMPASYTGLDSYGKQANSALLEGSHGELVHPPPPPPPPTHENVDEGIIHPPTGMSQALVQGHSVGHFPAPGHQFPGEASMHSLGAAQFGGGQPPHLGELAHPGGGGGGGGGFPHESHSAAIADRPAETAHDIFDFQYEGSGFMEGRKSQGAPLPGFKPLPSASVHNGHANAPYGEVTTFGAESNEYDEEHIPHTPSPVPSYNPGTFGSSFKNNVQRNYVANQYRPSRQAHTHVHPAPVHSAHAHPAPVYPAPVHHAPVYPAPYPRNNFHAPSHLNKHMYNSYEQMVEKTVENMFSGKPRGNYNYPHAHNRYPQRRYHLELDETPKHQLTTHKPRSTPEFHKSNNKNKSKAKRKHTNKGILVNLVKKRVDDD